MIGGIKRQDDANEEAMTELTPRLEIEGPPVLDDSTTLDTDYNEEACIEASTEERYTDDADVQLL